ncbi:MAG: ATP-binding cassette domain-containing protein [Rhodospirillaceae bacterium]|nr:ATP-binding cassette domain-containing protein [Rhodospirillaceae bacterium]
MAAIRFDRVSKIFGAAPEAALARLHAGADKAALLAETGHALALDEVSLQIARGEFFIVMGLSGSGKSTLVRLVNRLISPTAGSVIVDGIDLATLGAAALRGFRREKVSMVFQGFALLPHRTVAENVGFALELRGQRRAMRAAAARQAIAAVGLEGQEGRYPAELSGGMRQRVGLARALAAGTDILLMDEPFGALDPLTRRDMQDQLIALQSRLGKTIVFITHDLDEALRLAERLGGRIAILNQGRVVQVGSGREIVARPADNFVARFVATVAERGATPPS